MYPIYTHLFTFVPCCRFFQTVREDLEARREAEIKRIERRKDSHIAELMKSHEKAFGEIKNYYNDITHNNLDLIKRLVVLMSY